MLKIDLLARSEESTNFVVAEAESKGDSRKAPSGESTEKCNKKHRSENYK